LVARAGSDDDIRRLWNKEKIAIHFHGSGPTDSESIDPNDYRTHRERVAINTFRELNRARGLQQKVI